MIRKHTRRAAKAAFAISLGVAIVLGGTATVASAKHAASPTIIVGNKNFTEEYILGQLYGDRKSTRLNSSHIQKSRMPSSA